MLINRPRAHSFSHRQAIARSETRERPSSRCQKRLFLSQTTGLVPQVAFPAFHDLRFCCAREPNPLFRPRKREPNRSFAPQNFSRLSHMTGLVPANDVATRKKTAVGVPGQDDRQTSFRLHAKQTAPAVSSRGRTLRFALVSDSRPSAAKARGSGRRGCRAPG